MNGSSSSGEIGLAQFSGRRTTRSYAWRFSLGGSLASSLDQPVDGWVWSRLRAGPGLLGFRVWSVGQVTPDRGSWAGRISGYVTGQTSAAGWAAGRGSWVT